MARQLRVSFPGALYHITSRGNLRENIFFGDGDKEKFIEILARTKKYYHYILHTYVLLDNHYHLFIETPEANIQHIMHNINTSYTVYVNRNYHRSGHLFQGRYKAILVDKDNYLLALSRYIHLNPVRAGIAERPEDYSFSSYRSFIETADKENIVDPGQILAYFSKMEKESKRAYREFVEQGLNSTLENPFKQLKAGIILGNGKFLKGILKIVGDIKIDREVPALKVIRKTLTPDEVIKRVAHCSQIREEEITRRSRGKSLRTITLYLCKLLSNMDNAALGGYFNIGGKAVSKRIIKFEKEISVSEGARRKVEELKETIIERKKGQATF